MERGNRLDGWKHREEWLLHGMNSAESRITVTLSRRLRLETFIFCHKLRLNMVMVVSRGMLNVKPKQVEGFQGVISNLHQSLTLNIH